MDPSSGAEEDKGGGEMDGLGAVDGTRGGRELVVAVDEPGEAAESMDRGAARWAGSFQRNRITEPNPAQEKLCQAHHHASAALIPPLNALPPFEQESDRRTPLLNPPRPATLMLSPGIGPSQPEEIAS
jgi:hypothetical protein